MRKRRRRAARVPGVIHRTTNSEIQFAIKSARSSLTEAGRQEETIGSSNPARARAAGAFRAQPFRMAYDLCNRMRAMDASSSRTSAATARK